MASRAATTLACAVALVTTMAAVERAWAGQNCICECTKMCMQVHIPGMEGCQDKCKDKACVRSCEEACTLKGFPKQPHEGIQACELEPLTPDEEKSLS